MPFAVACFVSLSLLAGAVLAVPSSSRDPPGLGAACAWRSPKGARCRAGLHCVGGYCYGALSAGEYCDRANQRFYRCGAGLHCDGVCVKPRGMGGACGRPRQVCADGLWCMRGVCTAVAEVGGECGYRHCVCVHGARCMRRLDVWRCVRVAGAGGACDLPYTVCDGETYCRRDVGIAYCDLKS